MPSVEQIPAYLVWPLRQQVMYPEMRIDDVKLENDNAGIHFGLFDHNKLTSVVSVFENGDEIQFRKFATLNEYQGKGYGSMLLEYLINFAKEQGCKRLWCNARKNASAFYKKFGFTETTQTFFENGYDFVIMELYLQEH
jgi:GNAT superfamily N-acetyltransferase